MSNTLPSHGRNDPPICSSIDAATSCTPAIDNSNNTESSTPYLYTLILLVYTIRMKSLDEILTQILQETFDLVCATFVEHIFLLNLKRVILTRNNNILYE